MVKKLNSKKISRLLYEYFQPFYEFVGEAKAVTSIEVVDHVCKELGLKTSDKMVYHYYRNRILNCLFQIIRPNHKHKFSLVGLNHDRVVDSVTKKYVSRFWYPENETERRKCINSEELKGMQFVNSAKIKYKKSKDMMYQITTAKKAAQLLEKKEGVKV